MHDIITSTNLKQVLALGSCAHELFLDSSVALQDIVGCAVSESSKLSRDDRIVYRVFTEKEVEVDMS